MPIRLLLASAIVVAGLSLDSPWLRAQDDAKKPDAAENSKPADDIGYFLGISMGQQMSQSGFRLGDFSFDALVAGFSDGMEEKEPALSSEELKATEEKIQELLGQRYKEMIEAKIAKGQKWLESNAKEEGVKTLEQGLQYKVLTAGKGESPTATDTVRVHYTGKLTNGQVFDSSVERGTPAEFSVGRVIPGWTLALQKMKVGDKWMIYIPSDLAYGERGSQPKIGPHEVLIFEVELLAIL